MTNKEYIVEFSQPDVIVEIEQTEFVVDVEVGQKGDSAYKQAVDGGYTGTEEEFKAQLNALPELTSGADTSLHKHDQMYYTEDEIDGQMATKMNLDGSNSNIDKLTFNKGTLDATPLLEGELRWNPIDRTLDLGMDGDGIVQQIGMEAFYPHSKNVDTVPIPDGALVEYVGTLGNSGVMLVKRATSTMPRSNQILGVATETIPVNGDGLITRFGQVRAIQTNGADYGETWVDGDILYNNPNYVGGLTKVRPTAPFPTAIVAVVMRAHASNGSLFVRPDFLPYLKDLSDVEITNPLDGQVMTYNGTLKRWENKSVFASSPVNRALVFYNSTTGLYETYGGLALDPTYLSLVTNGVFSYTTYNKDYGYLALGTHVASTTVSRNIADALPALVVNQANPSSTGDLARFQFQGSNKVVIDRFGNIGSYQVTSTSGYNNARLLLDSTGASIIRDVADANPSLIVNQASAGSTGNIAEFRKSGNAYFLVLGDGRLQTSAVLNLSSANYAALNLTNNGAVIQRNVADSNSVLSVDNLNAASSGYIINLKVQGTTKAFVSREGVFYGAGIFNLMSSANAKLDVGLSGLVATRNVGDANPSLIVNQANASSTGNILDLQFQGITKARFNRFGELYATRLGNITNNNNAYIDVTDTGSVIYRNIADANSALTVNQVHASSTGKILDLQFGGVSKASFNKDGLVNIGSKTPSSATDVGVAGTVCWDANYIYVCVATNTWKRTAITTW